MTYGEIRTAFLRLLRRTDCTNADADLFLAQGMAKADRYLKLRSQELLDTTTVSDPFTGITLPEGLIRIINVYIDDGDCNRILERISLDAYLKKAATTSIPTWWTRNRDTLLINPTPLATSTIKLLYYGSINDFEDDDAETVLSAAAPDLFIYGGLTYAADVYLDERLPRYENRFNQILAELQGQADDDELAGGAVITPAYAYPSDEV